MKSAWKKKELKLFHAHDKREREKFAIFFLFPDCVR